MEYHDPVLLNEVLDFLDVEKGKKYIDATLGDGGHTIEILKRGGKVLGLDYSPESLERATERIKSEGLSENFVGVCANFKEIDQIAPANGFENADGILLDLGFSSFHVDDAKLGLSFRKDEPLDMRIDRSLNVTAADLINTLSEKQLENLFREYGEEKLAKLFAEEIVRSRDLEKITTTKQLADLLVEVAPSGYDGGRTHPARRVFQALRIVVNDEIENLKISLPRAARILKLPGGRMAIISFHSLEDRLAKQVGQSVRLSEKSDDGVEVKLEALNKKPITPSEVEAKKNKRARSAKLRVYERID